MTKRRFGRQLLYFLMIGAGFLCEARGDDQMRKLAEIQAKARRMDAEVSRLEGEKSAQIEALKKLEKQYGDQVNSLNAVKAEVRQQERMLQGVRDKVSATQKDVESQRRGLESLVKSAYAMGDKKGLDVMFNQKDLALSGRMLVYYDYIGKARVGKLQAIQSDMDALRQLEAQKDTEAQLLQLALQKKQQETDALSALRNQRETLLSEIERDYVNKRQQLAKLLLDEKKLEALVASLQKTDNNAQGAMLAEPVKESDRGGVGKPVGTGERAAFPAKPFGDLRGQLPWPVQGGILERFGSKRFETTWDGAVINAKEGADVHAVAAGRVVYADWLRGYGLMLIVDHGKGYLSLYAFNQNLHKNVGDAVAAGETLASVGRSGGRNRAALYFGIRHNGKAVDPEKWCRKPGKG